MIWESIPITVPRTLWVISTSNPYPQRTNMLRFLGPKTLLCKAFWAILMLRVMSTQAISSDTRILPKGSMYPYSIYLGLRGVPI